MVQQPWVAIGIGIAKVPGTNMSLLRAARPDAQRFCEWASRNGYTTIPITDEVEPVTADRLVREVDRVVRAKPQRLLIFFSGHGTALPEGDFWLMSDFKETGDAISVSLSERTARNHPIEQIAFIADACRSSIERTARVQPRNLFRYPDHDSRRGPRVDTFYATRLGAVAQETRSSDPAKTYGVFGNLVLQAIDGKVADAFERGRTPPTVSSQSLAEWLEKTVPLETGKIPGGTVQWPDARPGWFRPMDWYYNRPEPDIDVGPPQRRGASRSSRATDGAEPGPSQAQRAADAQAQLRVNAAATERAAIIQHHQDIISQSRGRQSFETQQGVTVVGARITAVAAEPERQAERFEEGGNWHVRTGEAPQSLALRLADTGWIALATIPGFIATVATANGRPVSVNYVPSRNTQAFAEYEALGSEEAAAEWLGLVSTGETLSRDRTRLQEFAERTREGKHRNPTLGILAAYAYDRAGDRDGVDSIAWHFADRDGIVPFDVALLSRARLRGNGRLVDFHSWNGHAAAIVAGAFPLMTQGWALLDEGHEGVPDELLELRRGLMPTPWTFFDLEHGDRLADLIRSGVLAGQPAPALA